MKTSATSTRSRSRCLFLTIAIVLWILPCVHAQTFEWVELAGGSAPGTIETDRAIGIASDGSNFVYVSGSFRGQAQFGTTTITSAGDTDAFLARYRTDGKLDWVRAIGGPGPDDGFDVKTDGNGTVCTTGDFVETADFGGVSLTSHGGRDVFVACFSRSGALKWARHGGSTRALSNANWNDYGTDVAIGTDGAVYVTGEFGGTAKFDGISVTSYGYSDGFLAKYDADGYVLWVKRIGGPYEDDGNALAVDPNGDLILTGLFTGSADFGSDRLHSVGAWDIYVSKWSPDGNVIWAKRAGGPANDRGGGGIAFDRLGDIYVTGYFKSTATFGTQSLACNGERCGFVWKFAHDGTPVWAVGIYGSGRALAGGVVYSPTDHLYLTGVVAGTAKFGTLTGGTSASQDAFAARLDLSGNFDWAITGGSSSIDYGYGIALNGPRVIVAGQVGGDPTFGSISLTYRGPYDAFLASIDLRPQPPTLISPVQDAAYISTSPSLVWLSVDLATRYNVQVASDAGFANIVYTENTPATHVTFTAPVAEHEYYWRVNGVGLVGPGEWSETRHFTVGSSGPLAPQLTDPADNVTVIGTSPTLMWLAAPEADWHRLQVSSSQAFVSPEISVDNLTGTTHQASGLDFDTRYFWRVAGVSESGKSTWSAPWSFVTIQATVAAPDLIAPAQDASDVSTSPDLVWSSVEHATRYNVQVASDDAFANLVLTENTPETHVTFVAPVAGHDYYWRVQGEGPIGGGPWSEVRHFGVGNSGPLAPELHSPTDNASGIDTSPALSWGAAPAADWHHLQLATNNSFDSPILDVDHVDRALLVGLRLSCETRFFWRVAGVNQSGKSTWSAPWSFVTMISPPGEVILLNPETGSEGVAAYASFDWQGMEGVDRYHLQVIRESPSSSSPIFVVDDSTLTVSQYTMTTPLEYSGSYLWKVRAHNESGFGPWCPEASFVVAIGTATEDPDEIPTEYCLAEPYPNPFNPSTRIEFGLPEAAHVTVAVFDATGRVAAVLADGHKPAGHHVVTWDASNVGSGVYFVRLQADGQSRTRVVVMTK